MLSRNKKILLAAIIIFIISLILFSVSLFSDKITIKSPDGKVKIDNIYKNKIDKLTQNDITFIQSDNFQIYYYPENLWFSITLLGYNLNKSRTEAEKKFLDTLGITKEQACKLHVNLGVPYSINSETSGQNYGLSFCSDSLSLP